MEAIAKSPSWARIEPLVRWLGVRLSPFVPPSLSRALDRQLLHAGDYLGLVPEEYAALVILSCLGGGLLGTLIDAFGKTGGLASVAFATFGMLAPYLQISGEAQRRFTSVNRGLPYAVDLVSLGMSAGLDFPGALRQFASKALPDDPFTEEAEYMLQMMQLGHTRRAALVELAERVPTEAVREFVQTVIHAEEKGHPLAHALAIQAQVSRMRRTVRAEEEAAKAGVKLIIPLTLIFGSVLVLLLGPVFLKVVSQVGGGTLHS